MHGLTEVQVRKRTDLAARRRRQISNPQPCPQFVESFASLTGILAVLAFLTVTAEAAGSSPVVPGVPFKARRILANPIETRRVRFAPFLRLFSEAYRIYWLIGPDQTFDAPIRQKLPTGGLPRTAFEGAL